MATPKWAENLILDALVFMEEQGHSVTVPTIKWHKGKHRDSSGCARIGDSIHITGGKHRIDAKLVVLHELAHWAAGIKPVYWDIEKAKKQGWHIVHEPTSPIVIKQMGHTTEFWDIAWQLYRWAKLPIRYCQQREYSYRVGAQMAYKRNRRK